MNTKDSIETIERQNAAKENKAVKQTAPQGPQQPQRPEGPQNPQGPNQNPQGPNQNPQDPQGPRNPERPGGPYPQQNPQQPYDPRGPQQPHPDQAANMPENVARNWPNDSAIFPNDMLHHGPANLPKQKIRRYTKDPGTFYFYCPGCREYHSLHTSRHNANGTVFTISGPLNRPTVTPLINRSIEKFNVNKYGNNQNHVCNSIIKDGTIRFLENCTHDLAGRVVELGYVD